MYEGRSVCQGMPVTSLELSFMLGKEVEVIIYVLYHELNQEDDFDKHMKGRLAQSTYLEALKTVDGKWYVRGQDKPVEGTIISSCFLLILLNFVQQKEVRGY
ncbi:hypothetical protein ACJX0J_009716 [Zea mays]